MCGCVDSERGWNFGPDRTGQKRVPVFSVVSLGFLGVYFFGALCVRRWLVEISTRIRNGATKGIRIEKNRKGYGGRSVLYTITVGTIFHSTNKFHFFSWFGIIEKTNVVHRAAVCFFRSRIEKGNVRPTLFPFCVFRNFFLFVGIWRDPLPLFFLFLLLLLLFLGYCIPFHFLDFVFHGWRFKRLRANFSINYFFFFFRLALPLSFPFRLEIFIIMSCFWMDGEHGLVVVIVFGRIIQVRSNRFRHYHTVDCYYFCFFFFCFVVQE